MNLIRGIIFYKYDQDNNPEILRLERIKNENCFVFTKKGDYKHHIKLNKEEFGEYTQLKPHGIISVTSVLLDDGKDVVVTLHRTSDIEEGEHQIPYAVCRQSVLDVFSNLTKKEGDMNIYTGLSISKDTCPPDIEYSLFLTAKSVLRSSTVAVYLDDTMDDILHFIPTSWYDEVLFGFKFPKLDNGYTVVGHCYTLRHLLDYTDFMYDFKRAFNVTRIESTITLNEDETIDRESLINIQNELGFIMYNAVGIEYGYDLDLYKIANDKVIVYDGSLKTYVVSYVRGDALDAPTRDVLQARMKYIASLPKSIQDKFIH